MLNLNQIKEFILTKTLKNAEKFGENTPVSVLDGKSYHYATLGDWRLGFWSGVLNYCYLLSENNQFREYARGQRGKLIDRLYNHPETLDHDIGFLYAPTEFANYKFDGIEESRKACIDAADALCARYNENGKYIVAWDNWPFSEEFSKDNDRRMIIDCMFNLPFLFEVAKLTGDSKYYNVAHGHATTCMKTIVRPDATTYHTYLFDRETGEPDRGETWQGYSDDSCWSRGQSWAVGGFTMAYRYTKDEAFLSTAIATADKFIDSLEPNYLPAWDFVFKGQDVPPDASAAAIAACGLLELADYVDGEKSAFYKDAAEKLVESLWDNCASKDDEEYEALIKRCTGFHRMDSEVDTGIIYGDYYFVKAVAKLSGVEWLFD